jgi:hypothetical protein
LHRIFKKKSNDNIRIESLCDVIKNCLQRSRLGEVRLIAFRLPVLLLNFLFKVQDKIFCSIEFRRANNCSTIAKQS